MSSIASDTRCVIRVCIPKRARRPSGAHLNA
jgi:hypothetical protein